MSTFSTHNPVAKGTRFEPAAGRYVLYVSYGCPFAHRALIALKMKGLEDAIQIVPVHPVKQRTKPDLADDTHRGFMFKPADGKLFTDASGSNTYTHDDVEVDPLHGFKSIRDVYEYAGAPEGTNYSVPVLFDKEEDTVVSVESGDLMRVFNSDFNDFAKNPELDLYPEALRAKIGELHEWIYADVIRGIFKAGLAKTQHDYETACDQYYAGLDRIEELLSESRYLVGDQLTELDIQLFVALVRVDEAAAFLFKLNKKLIREYSNIFNWLRDVYQFEGVADTVKLQHIKWIYFGNFPDYAPYGVYPKDGNFIESLQKPHGRERL